MNLLDRTLLKVAPGWGARRLRARAIGLQLADALERFQASRGKRQGGHAGGVGARGYDAASRSRRTQGWITVGGSANAENRPALVILRDRCRDLVRNNPHAATAVRVIASQIVGPGIRPTPIHEDPGVVRAATQLWEEWAETTACDTEGRMTFYGMQAAAVRSMVEGGESVIRQRPRREVDRVPGIPLQLQLLEGDHIDTAKDGMVAGTRNRVVQGVEFDAVGRRIAYHLFREHPGDSALIGFLGNDSVRVPAERISHVFRTDRIGQVRGISWAAPVIVTIHELGAYWDNEALRNVVATSYSAFVRDLEPGPEFTPAGAAQTSPASGNNANALGQAIDELEPGTIEHLPPGKSIEFSKPPQNEGFPEYSRATLRAVAKGIGITYEALTGDLRSTSFSSGRLGFLEFHRDVESWRRHVVIPQVCVPTWRWFNETAQLAGLLPEGVRARWTPPRREMINPQAEVKAMVDAVRAGFLDVGEAIRMFGFEPETTLRDQARLLRLAQALGLSLTTDGRLSQSNGGTLTGPAPDPDADPDDLPDQEEEEEEKGEGEGEEDPEEGEEDPDGDDPDEDQDED